MKFPNLVTRVALFGPLLLTAPLWMASLACAAAPPTAPMTSPDSANIIFPANAGVINVRDPQYGAKGDGQTDDTAAIQKAITENLHSHRVTSAWSAST